MKNNADIEYKHSNIKPKIISTQKLELVSLLLDVDSSLVELIYANIPNNHFIEEQIKHFKSHNIDVMIGFKVLGILSRI